MADESYDVVVLGSGIAGLAGGLAAAAKGLSAIVLEKAALLGGITCHSYGFIWVGRNHLADRIGCAAFPDEAAGKTLPSP